MEGELFLFDKAHFQVFFMEVGAPSHRYEFDSVDQEEDVFGAFDLLFPQLHPSTVHLVSHLGTVTSLSLDILHTLYMTLHVF